MTGGISWLKGLLTVLIILSGKKHRFADSCALSRINDFNSGPPAVAKALAGKLWCDQDWSPCGPSADALRALADKLR
jgi:hypothetical protein